MKTKANNVVKTEKSGIVFRSADNKFNTVKGIETEDGQMTYNSVRNEKGGRRAGSNYAQDEKTLRVANDLCKGISLEKSVFETYAHHGICHNTARKTYRPEVIGHVWGSEYSYRIGVYEGRKALMRMSVSANHETPDWEPVYYVDRKMAEVILVKPAESKRSESPKGYQTQGVTVNRNECVTAWKARH